MPGSFVARAARPPFVRSAWSDREEDMDRSEKVTVLAFTRALVEDPESWCQGRAKDGGRVCASQAYCDAVVVLREEGVELSGTHEVWELLLGAAEKMGYDGVARLNDAGPEDVAHARVLELFDNAIAEVLR